MSEKEFLTTEEHVELRGKTFLSDNSFLYKLDPRTKILLTLFLSCVVFLLNHVAAAMALCLVVIAVWFAAGMSFKKIAGYVKFFIVLLLLVTAMQVLFGPGTHYILKPLFPKGVPLVGGIGSLKWDGLVLGLMIGLRLASLVLLLPMLIGTTPPHLFAQGLNRMGINYRGAFIITSAINLVPALEEEARMIMDAQKLRGLRAFEEKKFFAKLKAYPALTIPLVVAAMRRAQTMAYAMDSRAFGASPKRTWVEPIKLTIADFWAFTFAFVSAGIVLLLNYLPVGEMLWQL